MKHSDDQTTKEMDQSQFPGLTAILRKRAAASRRLSLFVLLFLIGIVLGGGYAFWILPERVSTAHLVPTFNSWGSGWGSDNWAVDTGWSGSDSETEDQARSAASKTIEKLVEAKLKVIEERVAKMETAVGDQKLALEAVEAATTGLKQEIGKVDEIIKKVEELPREQRKHWEEFFTAFATRITIATLLLLVLKLLTSQYRYHVRLAAFYDAKADALMLGTATNLQELEVLNNILTPTSIDFHESADSLMQHAVDLSKKIVPSASA